MCTFKYIILVSALVSKFDQGTKGPTYIHGAMSLLVTHFPSSISIISDIVLIMLTSEMFFITGIVFPIKKDIRLLYGKGVKGLKREPGRVSCQVMMEVTRLDLD